MPRPSRPAKPLAHPVSKPAKAPNAVKEEEPFPKGPTGQGVKPVAKRESSAPVKPSTKPVSRPPVTLSPKEMAKLTPAQRAERDAQARLYRESLRKSKS